MTMTTTPRFSRIRNFRDLGGCVGHDGRRVRRGVLYRSGRLGHATRSDVRRIAELGIVTVVDLRSPEEREANLSRLPEDADIRLVELPILDQGNSAIFRETNRRIRERDFSDFDVDALMEETNRELARDWAEQFAAFLRELIRAEGRPVLWHCTGGKDRTGFAAAVLLRLLGVSEETIVADYLESRRHAALPLSRIAAIGLARGPRVARTVRRLTLVQESWIRAGLAEIDAYWGGFDRYVRDGLGLDASEIDRLRELFLEPA